MPYLRLRIYGQVKSYKNARILDLLSFWLKTAEFWLLENYLEGVLASFSMSQFDNYPDFVLEFGVGFLSTSLFETLVIYDQYFLKIQRKMALK